MSLTACGLFSPSLKPDPVVELTEKETALSVINHWAVSARMSVMLEQGAWSGGLRWQQQPDNFVFTVNAPLGQGALQLKGDNNGVRFRSADGHDFTADDLPAMMRDELGFDLPVIKLRDWIRGLPSKASGANIIRDDLTRIKSLQQGDWRVEYFSYQSVDQFELPRKLRIYGKDYQIRLVIYDWRLQL